MRTEVLAEPECEACADTWGHPSGFCTATTYGRVRIALCCGHRPNFCAAIGYDLSSGSRRAGRCASCDQRELTIEIEHGERSSHRLCLRCAEQFVRHLSGILFSQPGDAVEWDPHYKTPSWWEYSRKALQRSLERRGGR